MSSLPRGSNMPDSRARLDAVALSVGYAHESSAQSISGGDGCHGTEARRGFRK